MSQKMERKVINIGTADILNPEFDYMPAKFEWIVIDYSIDGYEGSGYAVLKSGPTLAIWNLCHCSCWGPGEETPDTITIARWQDDDVHTTAGFSNELIEKVNELLGGESLSG